MLCALLVANPYCSAAVVTDPADPGAPADRAVGLLAAGAGDDADGTAGGGIERGRGDPRPLTEARSLSEGPSCGCDEVVVAGAPATQASHMGMYVREDVKTSGRWVYMSSGGQYLYFWADEWLIGPTYTSD